MITTNKEKFQDILKSYAQKQTDLKYFDAFIFFGNLVLDIILLLRDKDISQSRKSTKAKRIREGITSGLTQYQNKNPEFVNQWLDFLLEIRKEFSITLFNDDDPIWDLRTVIVKTPNPMTLKIHNLKIGEYYIINTPETPFKPFTVGYISMVDIDNARFGITVVTSNNLTIADYKVNELIFESDADGFIPSNIQYFEKKPKFQVIEENLEELFVKNQQKKIFNPQVVYLNIVDNNIPESGFYIITSEYPFLIPEFELTTNVKFVSIVDYFMKKIDTSIKFSLELKTKEDGDVMWYRDNDNEDKEFPDDLVFLIKDNVLYPITAIEQEYIIKNVSIAYILNPNTELKNYESEEPFATYLEPKEYSKSDYFYYQETYEYFSPIGNVNNYISESWRLKHMMKYQNIILNEKSKTPKPNNQDQTSFKVGEKFLILRGDNPSGYRFTIFEISEITNRRIEYFYYPNNDVELPKIFRFTTVSEIETQVKDGNYLFENTVNGFNKDINNFYIKTESQLESEYGENWEESSGLRTNMNKVKQKIFFGQKVISYIDAESLSSILFSYAQSHVNISHSSPNSVFIINRKMITYIPDSETKTSCNFNEEDIMKGTTVKQFYDTNKERFDKINQEVSCKLLKALVSLSNYEVCGDKNPFSSKTKREPILIKNTSSSGVGIQPKKDLLSKIKNLK